jgi:poly-gamma-glutamate synthesis protein (capsule biosynthesis protein)
MHGAVKGSATAHRPLPPTPASAPASSLPGAGNDGYDWLYAPIADLLSQPDLMFANLETPVAPRADRGTRSMVFNAPLAAVQALVAAGVDVVSVANNHAFDQGRPGFLETLKSLDQLRVPYVGAGPDGSGLRRFTLGGMSLAFLGYATFFNQDENDCRPPKQKAEGPCVQVAKVDPDRAVAEVASAATSSDAVVVSIHWGNEYATQPTPDTVELAHRLADAGALVVFGHHPHVLQPIELYTRADGRVALICYSLGNFISNQSRRYLEGISRAQEGFTRDSALVRVTLARRDYGRGVTQVEVASADWTPLWTENDTVELDRKKQKAGAVPSIQVVSIDRALAQVQSQLRTLPEPVSKESQALYVKLRKREELFLKRREAIAEVLGEDLERDVSAAAPPAPTP